MTGFHYGLPPYADIVFQEDVQQRLTPLQLGVLAHLITMFRATGDGRWTMTTTQKEIAKHIGPSTGVLKAALDALEHHGIIEMTNARGLGRNRGSVSKTIYLLPALLGGSHTTPTDPGSRDLSNRDLSDRDPLNGDLSNEDLPYQYLQAVPPPQNSQEVSRSQISNPDVVDVSKHNNKTEPEIKRALDSLGWVGDYPTDIEADLLIAVAMTLKKDSSVRNPAGLLRSMITQGSIRNYALERGLLANDLNGSLAPTMDPVEYDTKAESDPRWKSLVESEASRRSEAQGLPYTAPRIRLEVAQELSEGPQAAAN